MNRPTPEYLDRDEPIRVPINSLEFKGKKVSSKGRREVLWQDGCLAEELGSASGFNSKNDATRNNTTYGEQRVLDDGTTESLIGCSSCGAMCTIVTSKRKGVGPGTKEDPNVVISVAEAPQPNPWGELGNFSDCKLGQIAVPEGAEALIEPQDLSETQKLFVRLQAGATD